jgi:hypothetical protein
MTSAAVLPSSSRAMPRGPSRGSVQCWVRTAPTPAFAKGQRLPTAIDDVVTARPNMPVRRHMPAIEYVIAAGSSLSERGCAGQCRLALARHAYPVPAIGAFHTETSRSLAVAAPFCIASPSNVDDPLRSPFCRQQEPSLGQWRGQNGLEQPRLAGFPRRQSVTNGQAQQSVQLCFMRWCHLAGEYRSRTSRLASRCKCVRQS